MANALFGFGRVAIVPTKLLGFTNLHIMTKCLAYEEAKYNARTGRSSRHGLHRTVVFRLY